MQNQQMLRQSQMMPGQYNMRAARGGMMPANIQKTIMQNPNMYVSSTLSSFVKLTIVQDTPTNGAAAEKSTNAPSSDATRAF